MDQLLIFVDSISAKNRMNRNRQLGAGSTVRLEAQLLPSTRLAASKRKEMEVTAEAGEVDGMEEETTSPARKK